MNGSKPRNDAGIPIIDGQSQDRSEKVEILESHIHWLQEKQIMFQNEIRNANALMDMHVDEAKEAAKAMVICPLCGDVPFTSSICGKCKGTGKVPGSGEMNVNEMFIALVSQVIATNAAAITSINIAFLQMHVQGVPGVPYPLPPPKKEEMN